MTPRLASPLLAAALVLAISTAEAQQGDMDRLVDQVLSRGDTAAVVHLGAELGPEGIANCLASQRRAARHLCAQAARHIERPWPVLAVLAGVLRDHDRQLASRAAESMAVVVAALEPGDLGPAEVMPAELESILRALSGAAQDVGLSPDVRALSIQAAGAIARVAGAGLAVARAAVADDEPAVRRAAVTALVGSSEPEDLAALGEVLRANADGFAVALAAGGICEATAGHDRALPAAAEARIREMLRDRDARPSIVAPILACLARTPSEQVAELRALAAEHPNEATRAAYAAYEPAAGDE